MYLITWITTHLPTSEGWMAELAKARSMQPYIILYKTTLQLVWETCQRFLHGSDLAGNRTEYLWYASSTLYQLATEPPTLYRHVQYDLNSTLNSTLNKHVFETNWALRKPQNAHIRKTAYTFFVFYNWSIKKTEPNRRFFSKPNWNRTCGFSQNHSAHP